MVALERCRGWRVGPIGLAGVEGVGLGGRRKSLVVVAAKVKSVEVLERCLLWKEASEK